MVHTLRLPHLTLGSVGTMGRGRCHVDVSWDHRWVAAGCAEGQVRGQGGELVQGGAGGDMLLKGPGQRAKRATTCLEHLVVWQECRLVEKRVLLFLWERPRQTQKQSNMFPVGCCRLPACKQSPTP